MLIGATTRGIVERDQDLPNNGCQKIGDCHSRSGGFLRGIGRVRTTQGTNRQSGSGDK